MKNHIVYGFVVFLTEVDHDTFSLVLFCSVFEVMYEERQKGSDTKRSQEVTQPSSDGARGCLISMFAEELDVSKRVVE